MQCLKTYTSCAEGTICSYSMLASWGTWDSDKKKSRKIAYLALFAKSIIFKLIYIYLFLDKMVAATYSLFRTSLTRGDDLTAMTVNCKWAWKRKSSLKDTARSLSAHATPAGDQTLHVACSVPTAEQRWNTAVSGSLSIQEQDRILFHWRGGKVSFAVPRTAGF